MNKQQTDSSKVFSLVHEKYQFHSKNAYDCIKKNDSRIIQLSTITYLTTDNNSIIEDFPIAYNSYGAEPYNDYIIKVADTYDTELYVVVHSRPMQKKVFLLPIVVGFKQDDVCDVVKLTDNGRIRSFSSNEYGNKSGAKDLFLNRNNNIRNAISYLPQFQFFSKEDAFEEFGVQGEMIAVNTSSGVYNNLNILTNKLGVDFLQMWEQSEKQSLNFPATAPSSTELVIQIWLHTIIKWKKRCQSRKIKLVYSSTNKTEVVGSVKDERIAKAKQTIIDFNKDIVVYVNNNDDESGKRTFRSYHMLQSQRCGFFRHYSNGKISYIAPTTVHYKNVCNVYTNGKTITYRNTEDFLREKSYLENDVCLMLKGNNINFKREKTFDFLGRKRLDFYLPDKNIAIECQGVQHFYPYGSKDADFESRLKRDTDKYNECKQNGITLLYYVNPSIPIPKSFTDKYVYITDLNELCTTIKYISV